MPSAEVLGAGGLGLEGENQPMVVVAAVMGVMFEEGSEVDRLKDCLSS